MFTENDFLTEINHLHSNQEKLDVAKFNTKTNPITVLAAYLGTEIMDPMFGIITGYFSFRNAYYKFHFHVHRPNTKYPGLSNRMNDITEIQLTDTYFVEHYSNFAYKALIPHTSMTELHSIEEVAVRNLSIRIKHWSQNNQLCKQLRRLDKQVCANNPVYKPKKG